jgi:hypothetical protein
MRESAWVSMDEECIGEYTLHMDEHVMSGNVVSGSVVSA